MKRLLFIFTLTVATAAVSQAGRPGFSYLTVNGQTFTIFDSGSNWFEITGPNGYHADGWRYYNGDVDLRETGECDQ